ncbi:OmpA/MotB domain protein [Geofilum rubicundum JCM 15548]|uniref:OmpA/MotB domain protein n=2 Tax=Geofilum TaxID=1236988 RepID=A0A0E9M0V5_9BACT|nr:OmpA/MotB domain protein [Geofilum rubicundum JCM 15548]
MRYFLMMMVMSALVLTGCKSLTGTQKGAAIGTAGGAAAGAIIGRTAGNTAVGAVVGATVGGVTGAIIGNKMDKQAEEMKAQLPDANVERVGEGIIVELSNNILFGFDSYELSSTARTNLNKMITVFDTYPDTDIEVQGHTDSSGSDTYNQDLSERRANAVTSYLVNRGVSSSRLTTVGYGETSPKYSNDTEEGRAQNRRVEFIITANEKMKREAEREASN